MSVQIKPRLSVIVKIGMSFMLVLGIMTFNSCGSKTSGSDKETASVSQEEFNASQPVQSGLYDADYYDIVGKNPRRGKFDGRIYFALQPSPDLSAINVFENGNRTKIDYTIVLQKPFEKNDSGVYVTVDKKDNPVCVVADSVYSLKFIHFNDTVQINFNPKARHTGTAVEILEKINERTRK